MKKISAVLIVAILAVCLSAAHGQDAATDLKALDAKLTDAFKTRDFDKLDKHTDEGYILIDPRGGVHTKKQYLGHLKDGASKVKDLKETDVKVKVFGDTAVVTGVLHVTGKFEDKEINAEYRWTRVYHKSGDHWHCILEQHTFVHPKEKAK